MAFPASSKINSSPFSAHVSTNTQKSRPRGGWEDDDQNDLFTNPNTVTFTGSNVTQLAKPTLNVATGNKILPEPAKFSETTTSNKYLGILTCDDAFFESYAFEAKVIGEIVQPGGARLKQSDAVLLDFCRACESMQTDVVGSILLNNLDASVVFVSKARALFAIEALIKKVKKFNGYFNHNQKALAAYSFSEENNVNASQLKKIREDIVNHLNGVTKTQQTNNQQAITPKTAVSTTKPINNQSQPQSAQSASVGLNANTNSNVPKNTAQTATTQPQQNKPQGPSTAQLSSQSKPNPFGIVSNKESNSAATTKPSGLPGAFKNKLNKNPEASIVSPSSASSQNMLQTPNSAQSQNMLSAQLNSRQQAVQETTSASNIIDSLAGLNFNEYENQHNYNGNYQVNQHQYGYNGQNFGQMQYPPVQETNMNYGGPGQYNYPPQNQYNYPNAQFNGQFNGQYNGQYNNQQFPQQFNPQYNQQYQSQQMSYQDPHINNQMQGVPQMGQMYNQGHQTNQSNNYELEIDEFDQPDPEQEEAMRREAEKKEQQRLLELQRKKQQEENEKKFEILNNFM